MTAKSTASPVLDETLAEAPAADRSPLEDAVGELADRAGKVAHETFDNLRTRAQPYVEQAKPYIERAKPYVDDASEHIAQAERYIVERVNKQPITTTLAILGVGVLVGLALSGGRSR